MEARTGLLHERLVKLIEERWPTGGIAIFYVRLELAGQELGAALAEWEHREPGLFWQWRSEWERVYFMHYPSMDLPLEVAMMRSAERLRLALDDACAVPADPAAASASPYRIGSALALPPEAPARAEEIVFRRLRRAMAAADAESGVPSSSPWEPRRANGAYEGELSQRYVIGMLSSPVPLFGSGAKVSELAHMFDVKPKEQAAVIVRDDRPVGLVTKQKLHQLLAGQFGFALYAQRPVERIMDRQPLIVEDSESVEAVSQMAMARDYSQLYDVIVTVRDGKVSGVVSIRDLLECMTALRTEEARTASPLTGLPGNTGIRDELARRISEGGQFAVIYADLDYFKWFNDCYGFARGDDMIRYLGELMVAVFRDCEHAFVGHVGGDDFIAVASPDCAEEACRQLIARFDEGTKTFYGDAGAAAAEDRDGRQTGQHGVTLSLSLLICNGDDSLNLEDVSICAAGLKKKAKAMPGSICVTGELKGGQPGQKRGQLWSNSESTTK